MPNDRRPPRAAFVFAFAFSWALALLVGRADAGLAIVAPTDVVAARGPSGPANYFDVVLTADGSNPLGPFDVNAFNVRLAVDGTSGVTFASATTDTAAPYVFSSVATLGFDAAVSDGGTTIDFSDFGLAATDVQAVAKGDTFGLGRVFFDVAPSARVSPPLVAIVVGSSSDVVDPDGVSFSASLTDGGIRVTGGTAIPEPSALVLAGIALVCGGIFQRRPRR